MNILITGITSFLGRAIAREYISRNCDVYGVVRNQSISKMDDMKDVLLHILPCEMDSIEEICKMKLPEMDICIHLTWDGVGVLGRMDDDAQVRNKEYAIKTCKVASHLNCKRFIFIGSQAEYGVTYEKIKSGEYEDIPISENHPARPISAYGKAKLELLDRLSRLCDELGMIYIHARVFSVYGPEDHDTSLISNLISACINHQDITVGPCKQLWNYIYITDLARAIYDLSICNITYDPYDDITSRVVNIAGDETKQLREYAKEVKKALDSDINIIYKDNGIRAEGTPYLNPSIDKLKRMTGFKMHTLFAEGVRKIEEMYRLWSNIRR